MNKEKNEYFQWIRNIMQSELVVMNNSHTITILAVPILRYSFRIIQWTYIEHEYIDQKSKKYTNDLQISSSEV